MQEDKRLAQQQEQFEQRFMEERRQFDREFALADLKVREGALQDAQRAQENALLRQAYLQKYQAMQGNPEFAKQEYRRQMMESAQSPETMKKMEGLWEEQDQQEQYMAAAQGAQEDIASLVEDGVLTDEEAQSANQELQARTSKQQDISGVVRGLEEKRVAHAQQIKSDEDWAEVLQYGQQAIEQMPPGPATDEMRMQLIDMQSHKAARKGRDPFAIKAEMDQILSETRAPGLMGQLGASALQYNTAGFGGQQQAPSAQEQVEGVAEEAEQFPGAQPGAEREASKEALNFALGVEPPPLGKTSFSEAKKVGKEGRHKQKGKSKKLGHPDFPMGVR
jgi:hypothetical protein